MRRHKLKTGMLLILSAVLFLTGCTSGEKKARIQARELRRHKGRKHGRKLKLLHGENILRQ